MKIRYIEKVSVSDIFACQVCGHRGRDKYLATPEVVTLVDWRELHVCKKCANISFRSYTFYRKRGVCEEKYDGMFLGESFRFLITVLTLGVLGLESSSLREKFMT